MTDYFTKWLRTIKSSLSLEIERRSQPRCSENLFGSKCAIAVSPVPRECEEVSVWLLFSSVVSFQTRKILSSTLTAGLPKRSLDSSTSHVPWVKNLAGRVHNAANVVRNYRREASKMVSNMQFLQGSSTKKCLSMILMARNVFSNRERWQKQHAPDLTASAGIDHASVDGRSLTCKSIKYNRLTFNKFKASFLP